MKSVDARAELAAKVNVPTGYKSDYEMFLEPLLTSDKAGSLYQCSAGDIRRKALNSSAWVAEGFTPVISTYAEDYFRVCFVGREESVQVPGIPVGRSLLRRVEHADLSALLDTHDLPRVIATAWRTKKTYKSDFYSISLGNMSLGPFAAQRSSDSPADLLLGAPEVNPEQDPEQTPIEAALAHRYRVKNVRLEPFVLHPGKPKDPFLHDLNRFWATVELTNMSDLLHQAITNSATEIGRQRNRANALIQEAAEATNYANKLAAELYQPRKYQEFLRRLPR